MDLGSLGKRRADIWQAYFAVPRSLLESTCGCFIRRAGCGPGVARFARQLDSTACTQTHQAVVPGAPRTAATHCFGPGLSERRRAGLRHPFLSRVSSLGCICVLRPVSCPGTFSRSLETCSLKHPARTSCPGSVPRSGSIRPTKPGHVVRRHPSDCDRAQRSCSQSWDRGWPTTTYPDWSTRSDGAQPSGSPVRGRLFPRRVSQHDAG